jgi:hypothetical protein
MSAQAFQSMAQQRLAGERYVLLGPITSKALAATRRHDQRDTRRQDRLHSQRCRERTLGCQPACAKRPSTLASATARAYIA